MDGSASPAEQRDYAQRLISAGERLQRRATAMQHPVIEGEVGGDVSLVLPGHTVEPLWEPLEVQTPADVDTAPDKQENQLDVLSAAYHTPHSGGTG
jgi:hypothetical protein